MSSTPKRTAKEAAAWMAAEVMRDGFLEQDVAAAHLGDEFGRRFILENDSGGLSISKEVLAEFRALTEKTVVWDRTEKSWRRRESGDGKGRLAEGT